MKPSFPVHGELRFLQPWERGDTTSPSLTVIHAVSVALGVEFVDLSAKGSGPAPMPHKRDRKAHPKPTTRRS